MPTSQLIDSVARTTAHRDRDELDVSIARLLVEFMQAKSVTIYRLLRDDVVTRVARRVGVVRGQEELRCEDVGDFSTLPELDDVPVWRDCVRDLRLVEHTATDGRQRCLFPIESEQRVVGLMEIEPRRLLRQREVELIGAILSIVKNHLALLDYGECDTLTGLMNRKTFESSFEKLRGRAAKSAAASGEPWLGVVDIDKFKSINDTYGHLFGDEVLLLVARLMKQNFRGADQLFRFGGEEFVVILDRASEAGAAIAFERLRASMEAFEFPQVGRVTISLGYARVAPQDSPTTCLERADAALYYAKHHGRNNARNYEGLVAAGEIALPAKRQNDVELF
jgi:diguanylate cyclase (GGDEF)-like protein